MSENMLRIKEAVEEAASLEHKRSYEKHPAFNSAHEGYAVIAEEVDEAMMEMEYVMKNTSQLWERTKRDADTVPCVDRIKIFAINCAAELIQVIAMCDKYAASKEQWK